MRAIEIRERLRETPFRPLRIHVSDGSFYDVPHPEFVLVGKAKIVIGFSAGEDMLPRRTAVCDPIHITRIEPLEDDDSTDAYGR